MKKEIQKLIDQCDSSIVKRESYIKAINKEIKDLRDCIPGASCSEKRDDILEDIGELKLRRKYKRQIINVIKKHSSELFSFLAER